MEDILLVKKLGRLVIAMNEFVYLIKPIRSNFINSMTAKESDIMERHFLYLKQLLQEQKLIMAGPCLDGAFGIVILRAESMETAREIMENDPAIKEEVMSSELHPYRVSLLEGK